MSVEKVPARSVGKPQASAKGNHDNPVSSIHPGTVTLNTQWTIEYLPLRTWREGKDGSKAFFCNCICNTTQAKWLTSTGELHIFWGPAKPLDHPA